MPYNKISSSPSNNHTHHKTNRYIYKVLKEAHDLGLSKKGMETMNSFVFDFFHRILKEAKIIQQYTRKISLTAREIQTATQLVLIGEIAKHCRSEGEKAMNLYHSSLGSGSGSKASRSGLIFPVGRIARYIKQYGYADRVGNDAGIYLSAVLQYLTHEVLEMAGKIVEDQNKKRIDPRHVMLALMDDDEFSQLMEMVCIPYAGVKPDSDVRKRRNVKSVFGGDGDIGMDAQISELYM